MTARTDGGSWHHAVPLPGGGVWLDRDAAAFVMFLLRYHVQVTGARNGLTDVDGSGPLAREVRSACQASTRGGMSSVGPIARTSHPARAPSTQPDDLLTTAETAVELHISERHARRLACAGQLGEVTNAGRVIQVRRFEVEAYRSRREAG